MKQQKKNYTGIILVLLYATAVVVAVSVYGVKRSTDDTCALRGYITARVDEKCVYCHRLTQRPCGITLDQCDTGKDYNCVHGVGMSDTCLGILEVK